MADTPDWRQLLHNLCASAPTAQIAAEQFAKLFASSSSAPMDFISAEAEAPKRIISALAHAKGTWQVNLIGILLLLAEKKETRDALIEVSSFAVTLGGVIKGNGSVAEAAAVQTLLHLASEATGRRAIAANSAVISSLCCVLQADLNATRSAPHAASRAAQTLARLARQVSTDCLLTQGGRTVVEALMHAAASRKLTPQGLESALLVLLRLVTEERGGIMPMSPGSDPTRKASVWICEYPMMRETMASLLVTAPCRSQETVVTLLLRLSRVYSSFLAGCPQLVSSLLQIVGAPNSDVVDERRALPSKSRGQAVRTLSALLGALPREDCSRLFSGAEGATSLEFLESLVALTLRVVRPDDVERRFGSTKGRLHCLKCVFHVLRKSPESRGRLQRFRPMLTQLETDANAKQTDPDKGPSGRLPRLRLQETVESKEAKAISRISSLVRAGGAGRSPVVNGNDMSPRPPVGPRPGGRARPGRGMSGYISRASPLSGDREDRPGSAASAGSLASSEASASRSFATANDRSIGDIDPASTSLTDRTLTPPFLTASDVDSWSDIDSDEDGDDIFLTRSSTGLDLPGREGEHAT